MSYFHVRVSTEGARHDEVKTDLDEETLERQFLAPYRLGRPITVNGQTIPIAKVSRIRIAQSAESSAQIIEWIKAGDRNSRVVNLGGPSYAWRAAARALDVTDQFITGPPGEETPSLAPAHAPGKAETLVEPMQSGPTHPGDPGSVFVVAGRDSEAASAIGTFLRALGLQVVEWEHAVARTGLPNPYVGDVVEAGLRMAGAAVVLITPDDLVQLRADLLHDDDGLDEREVRGQARPNVYYEAGIADGLGRDRTVIVEVGAVKSFSDAAGRHVVRFDGSPGKRHALAERLKLAGLAVNTGGQAWLTAGDVSSSLNAAGSAIEKGAAFSAAATIEKEDFLKRVDTLLAMHATMSRAAKYADLSDLEAESLEFAFRAQAFMDRYAADTPYSTEVLAVRTKQPHERIPVLVAALRSLRAETE